jgi:hypothetical protein
VYTRDVAAKNIHVCEAGEDIVWAPTEREVVYDGLVDIEEIFERPFADAGGVKVNTGPVTRDDKVIYGLGNSRKVRKQLTDS